MSNTHPSDDRVQRATVASEADAEMSWSDQVLASVPLRMKDTLRLYSPEAAMAKGRDIRKLVPRPSEPPGQLTGLGLTNNQSSIGELTGTRTPRHNAQEPNGLQTEQEAEGTAEAVDPVKPELDIQEEANRPQDRATSEDVRQDPFPKRLLSRK